MTDEQNPQKTPRAVIVAVVVGLLTAVLLPVAMCGLGIFRERREAERKEEAEAVRRCQGACRDQVFESCQVTFQQSWKKERQAMDKKRDKELAELQKRIEELRDQAEATGASPARVKRLQRESLRLMDQKVEIRKQVHERTLALLRTLDRARTDCQAHELRRCRARCAR